MHSEPANCGENLKIKTTSNKKKGGAAEGAGGSEDFKVYRSGAQFNSVYINFRLLFNKVQNINHTGGVFETVSISHNGCFHSAANESIRELSHRIKAAA